MWTFHTTGVDDGKAVDYAWRRRIEEILPGDRIRVTPHYEADVFDSSWNPIYADRPDFIALNFQFPLRVGAAWSYASPAGASTLDGRGYEHRGRMNVVAYESITVPAGTTVVWTNDDTTGHTVTADDGSFDSKTIDAGGTFSQTFAAAGSFTYKCTIHSSMTATVVVQ